MNTRGLYVSHMMAVRGAFWLMFFAPFHLSLSQLDLYELPHVTIDVPAVSTCMLNMSVNEYYHWSEIDDGWVCPTECKKETFPFYDASLFTDESSLQASSVSSITGANQQQHLKILSLNAQSLFQNLMSYTLIAFASLPTSS